MTAINESEKDINQPLVDKEVDNKSETSSKDGEPKSKSCFEVFGSIIRWIKILTMVVVMLWLWLWTDK